MEIQVLNGLEEYAFKFYRLQLFAVFHYVMNLDTLGNFACLTQSCINNVS